MVGVEERLLVAELLGDVEIQTKEEAVGVLQRSEAILTLRKCTYFFSFERFKSMRLVHASYAIASTTMKRFASSHM